MQGLISVAADLWISRRPCRELTGDHPQNWRATVGAHNVGSVVQRHRVLDAGFRLEWKAFMLTFNGLAFNEATWPEFRDLAKSKSKDLGACRWAACIEKTEDAAAACASAGLDRHHLHAYFWWTDGVGLRRRNADDLVFLEARGATKPIAQGM